MFGAQLRCPKCHQYAPDRCVCGKDPALKGKRGGNCNREACQKPGATYYNHAMRKHYCKDCALLLNSVNRDWAMPQYGHDLCTFVGDTPAAG
jgi:methionyl-tRNA synthetase